MNGLFAAFSGTPFSMTASGTNAGGLNTPSNMQTADMTGSFNETGNIGSTGAWFDTTQFAQPTGVRFGNTTRNQFYGPGGYTLDFSVFRSFPMGGQRRLEARVEAGNVFNHAIYGNPQGNVTSGTYGQITGINGNYPERQIRLGIRFQF